MKPIAKSTIDSTILMTDLIIDVGTLDVQAAFRTAWDSNPAPDFKESLLHLSDNLASNWSNGWPVGYEKELLQNETARISPFAPLLEDPMIRSVHLDVSDDINMYLQRPDSELAGSFLWKESSQRPIVASDFATISYLSGGPGKIRNGDIYTLPYTSGHRVKFVTEALLESRIKGLVKMINDFNGNPETAFEFACMLYTETLIIHPLVDGNGRLARLLFQWPFLKSFGLRAPVLPLGPIYMHSKQRAIYSYLLLITGDARPLNKFLIDGFAVLLELAKRRWPV